MLALVFVNIPDLDDHQLMFYNIEIHDVINEISKDSPAFLVTLYKYMFCPDFI